MQLEGRTFLVAGGSSGLGAACVRRLSGRGASVVIADIDERGAALAGELESNVKAMQVESKSGGKMTNALERLKAMRGGGGGEKKDEKK